MCIMELGRKSFQAIAGLELEADDPTGYKNLHFPRLYMAYNNLKQASDIFIDKPTAESGSNLTSAAESLKDVVHQDARLLQNRNARLGGIQKHLQQLQCIWTMPVQEY